MTHQPVDNSRKRVRGTPRTRTPGTPPKQRVREGARTRHAHVAHIARFTLKTAGKRVRGRYAHISATVPPAHVCVHPPSLGDAHMGTPRTQRTRHGR